MVTNKKVYGRAMAMPAGIGVGTVISMVLMLAGAAFLAFMLDQQTMDMDCLGYGIMGVLLFASLVGSIISAALVKRRKLLVCLIQATCFYALMLLLNGLLFGGAVTGALVTAVLVFGGSCSGALLASRSPGRKKNKFRKMGTG